MKKILALALCLVMVLALAACGETQNPEITTGTTAAPTVEATTEATTEAVEKPSYKITVVAEDGTPFVGLVVQLCNDEGCNPAVTDANGTGKTEISDSDLTWKWKNT